MMRQRWPLARYVCVIIRIPVSTNLDQRRVHSHGAQATLGWKAMVMQYDRL